MKLLWLFTCAAVLSAWQENPRTSPADVELGAKTFRSHCSPCHGIKGEGGRGPSLTTGRFYRARTDAEMLAVISNGVAGTEMPGLFYSPDRVWQVVAYIRSLNAHAATVGDGARGEKLYRSKGCAQCHRVQGQGSHLGPELSFIGQSRSAEHLRQAILEPSLDVRDRYRIVTFVDGMGGRQEGFLLNEDTYTIQVLNTSDQLRTYLKAQLKEYKLERSSKMPSYKGALTEAEVGDLVAFLQSLRGDAK
jgi:cytochrome c oxidase cbb3-type subunit III